jgi:ribonuclease HI
MKTHLDENAINIYTDGSSYNSPRKGGMGLRIITVNEEGNEVPIDIPLQGYKNATNNQMELQACVQGIKEAQQIIDHEKYKRIIIYSDSQYLVKYISTATFQWSKNHWKNHAGKPVENAEIWKELVKEISKCKKKVDFQWVKGHAKDPHNKAVDKMAKNSAKGVLLPAKTITKVRRKLTDTKVEIGSVKLTGQRLIIRIITDEYLHLPKEYKYKYEVMSKTNEFYGNVDIIYSSLMLNAGHTFFVKVNSDNKNPQIEKLYREINSY